LLAALSCGAPSPPVIDPWLRLVAAPMGAALGRGDRVIHAAATC
jgi:hypothetical protein